MKLLQIAVTSLVSLLVLLILTKLVGNRQLSELNMFDYIVSITIGSIAAEMATELENPERPLVAMVIYALVSIIFSFATSKSLTIRRLLFGQPVFLMKNGKLFRDNFQKSRLDLGEFLMQCRLAGYYNIADLDSSIMEPNGKISFLPLADKRPATPEDMQLKPQKDHVFINVVLDGEVSKRNLKTAGWDETALRDRLKREKVSLQDVFLATLDTDGEFHLFKADEFQKDQNFFD